MKTWEDLENMYPKVKEKVNELKKQWVGDDEIKLINFTMFKCIIVYNPRLINDYSHLVDLETLKEVLDSNPLTKLYLE